ncbi:MAG TPA: phosphotransferase [Kineosporiaceae bacterium]|nr:phosphotransferase [Kineosporiaceae bacterium]
MAKPPQWTAERPVDAERAAELISGAFPQLRDLPVVPLAEGWDNTVHVVDGVWAFRFPRRAVALPGVRAEQVVLPLIAPLLPLPVPVPQFVAMDDDPVEPWPFAGSRLIRGQELAEAALPEEARLRAASAMGAFLRSLHAPATRAAADVGRVVLPIDPNQRGWPRTRIDGTRQVLQQIVADGIWAGDPAVVALLADAEQLDAPSADPVLVHGDLHVRHLLIAEGQLSGEGELTAEGRPTGVIDWGDVCLADPAVDLALAYAAFIGPARAALLAAYGRVEPERELRARALAIRLSGFLVSYAAADARPRLLAESLAGLHRAVN